MFSTVAHSMNVCHAGCRSLGQVKTSWHSSTKRWVNLGLPVPERKLEVVEMSDVRTVKETAMEYSP
jgi:hypothetical protein